MTMRIALVFLAILTTCANRNLSNKDEIVNLNGTVIYRFQKGDGFYWLRDIRFYSDDRKIEHQIRTDIHGLNKIVLACQTSTEIDSREIEKTWGLKTSLYNSPKYRDQQSKGDNPVHRGGDIYFVDPSTIAVAFKIIGRGIILKTVCAKYLDILNDQNTSVPCELQRTKLQTPFVQMLYYDSTYSIDSRDWSTFSLHRSDLNSFEVMYCE